ncbi:MAG TPA: 2-oxoacid:ferredoxin oxidoreductase subunit beta [Chloroflexota bacterium]|nr:2-oxoacid:ferredoxin oxidoreductase subunit beta [Chloroflexota bacterium]
MSDLAEGRPAELTIDEYKSGEKPTWCPGCGDFGVLNAVYNALLAKGYNSKDVVCISGIGCSSRLPYFMSTYGFHSIHGRAMPIATGIKVGNPELKVLAFGGDGDAFAIGAGHFVHAVRRNLDLTYVIMDNAIYGLTKGQTSPTSMVGFQTKTTPSGSIDRPLNPLMLAITAGATFVARAFSGKPKELADLIVKGIDHKGFAVIDVFSPCPTFNKVNTFKAYREEVASVPANHDPSDKVAALGLANSEHPLYTGVIYEDTGVPTYEESLSKLHVGGEENRRKVIDGMLARYS